MQIFLRLFSFMTIPYSSIQDCLIDKLKPDFSPRNKDLTSAQLQTAAASSHPHKFQRSLPHPSPIPSISKIFLSVKPQPRQTLFHPLTAADCLAANRNLSCISFTASYFRVSRYANIRSFCFILSHFSATFQMAIKVFPYHTFYIRFLNGLAQISVHLSNLSLTAAVSRSIYNNFPKQRCKFINHFCKKS